MFYYRMRRDAGGLRMILGWVILAGMLFLAYKHVAAKDKNKKG